MTDRGTLMIRAAGALGASWGALLLARGDAGWRAVEHRKPSRGEGFVVDVLGVRHLAQGLAELIVPQRCRPLWIFVDLTHAASMVVLALVNPDRRRVASISAGAALTCATVMLAAKRVSGASPS